MLFRSRARYAPSPADGSALREDSAAVRQAIAAAVPPGVRWRARLLPPSVLGPALTSVAPGTRRYRGAGGFRGLGLQGVGLRRLGIFRGLGLFRGPGVRKAGR